MGDGGEDEGGITDWRQVDEDRAVGEGGGNVVGDGQGKAGLPHPAGTGEGQQRNGSCTGPVTKGPGLCFSSVTEGGAS